MIDVEIQSLAPGGDGVGRQQGGPDDGRVVFVPLSAAGDRVRVRLTEARRRFARGEIVEVIRPSVDRVPPPCPLFGRCGGCQWQHVNGEQQRNAKTAIAARALGVPASDVAVEAVGPDYGYRDRARMVVGRDRGGQIILGFRQHRSHHVIDVPDCPLLSPALRGFLPVVRAEAGGLAPGDTVLLQSAGDRVAARLGDRVLGFSDQVGDTIDLAAPGEPSFTVRVGGFAQVGRAANRALVDAVMRFMPERVPRLLELYAGAGNFTRFLVARADHLVASDGDPTARAMGQRNVPGAHWCAPDAVATLPGGHAGFDVVLIDPPRTGLDAQGLRLTLSARSHIVYISCNPQTFARDARILHDQGWRLARAMALDLMPQTYHLELVALFTRAEN